jgi:RNA polymerase sigma-70 factor (ECF subfamily)
MKDLEREFEQMVRENRSTIYTVCYMFSNDQDEVADLFQEVLINLWKSLPSFEERRGNVRSWIYRVSLNVCISLDRKKRRNKTVPLTMDIDPYEEVESNQNSRQMDLLRRRIAKLGQYDRAIILLWLENMSYEEIAAVMGITVKNVSVRLYRIKEELKNMSNE